MRLLHWTLLLPVVGACSTQGQTYTFYPDQTTLKGKLVEIHKRVGSASLAVLAVKLGQPLCVRPSSRAPDKDIDSGTFTDVRVIQVFFPGAAGDRAARRLLGKAITVTGTLSERLTPGQFTDVTMQANAVPVR